MKPVHICGSDDAIIIGRTRFGGYALRNVTRVVNSRTVPQLKQRLALAQAANASFGRSWEELIANVATQASGSKGGMSVSQRRELKHRAASGKIAAMQSQIASLEGRAPAAIAPTAGYAGLPGLF